MTIVPRLGLVWAAMLTLAAPAAAQAPEGDVFLAVRAPGSWKVSDLRSRKIVDAQGKEIGDVRDVLVGPDGRVSAVIVGVGGFLGIGEKNVAVAVSALQLTPPPPPQPAVPATPGGVPGGPPPAPEREPPALPERIVLGMDRAQLQAAPAFEDGKTAVRSTGGGEPPAAPPPGTPN